MAGGTQTQLDVLKLHTPPIKPRESHETHEVIVGGTDVSKTGAKLQLQAVPLLVVAPGLHHGEEEGDAVRLGVGEGEGVPDCVGVGLGDATTMHVLPCATIV